jgi:hypothetical protein
VDNNRGAVSFMGDSGIGGENRGRTHSLAISRGSSHLHPQFTERPQGGLGMARSKAQIIKKPHPAQLS